MLRHARPVARAAAALALVAGLAAACLPGTGPAIGPGTRTCTGLPQDLCAEAFAGAEAQARDRGTVVIGIAVRCTTVCTAASGEAEQTVTFGDGSREQGGFGWSSALPAPIGPPVGGSVAPEPSLSVAPSCLGLDELTCAARALEAVDDLDVDPASVVSIDVRCTTDPCTPTDGTGTTTLTLADGQVMTTDWTYGAVP